MKSTVYYALEIKKRLKAHGEETFQPRSSTYS